MDKALQVLIGLLDRAVKAAENAATESKERKHLYGLTARNLKQLRSTALAGKLPRPSQGATLGLSQNIGEFDSGETYTLGAQIDDHYRQNM
jgi:hypothetical protein